MKLSKKSVIILLQLLKKFGKNVKKRKISQAVYVFSSFIKGEQTPS